MLRYRLTILLLALAGVCSAAMGQTPTRDHPFPEVIDARHWGPFRVDPKFAIDNIGYDGNVYLTPAGARDPETGELIQPQSDVDIRLGPDVRAQTGFGPKLMLTLHDKLIYEFMPNHSDINHFDNAFEGQFDVLLGPVLLTTGLNASSYKWRPTSEFVQREREDLVEVKQTARIFLGPYTDLALFAGRRRYTFSLSTSLDRDREDIGIDVGWRPRARTRLFATVARRTSTFRNPPEDRDSRELRRLVGLEFSATSRISGRLAIGRTRLESTHTESSRQPYDGPISETEITYRPTGATRITGMLKRDIIFSTVTNNLYYNEKRQLLGIEHYLGSFLGFQLGGEVVDNQYPESTPIYVQAIDGSYSRVDIIRHDRIKDMYVGVLFRLKGGFQVGLRFGRRQRESNDPSYRNDQRYMSTSGSYVF